MTSKLDFDLYTMFLYLANATMCINETSKNQVWNDMAYKLMEWNNISRCELRQVFNKFDMEFKELCSECNEELNDYDGDDEEPKCDNCK